MKKSRSHEQALVVTAIVVCLVALVARLLVLPMARSGASLPPGRVLKVAPSLCDGSVGAAMNENHSFTGRQPYAEEARERSHIVIYDTRSFLPI